MSASTYPKPGSPTAPVAKVARAATAALALVGLLAIALAVRAMLVAGIGYDALFETQASLVNRAIDPSLTLTQAYELAPITSEFYGMLSYQIAEVAHQLLTGATEWMSPDDPSTYLWQNAVTIAYSILGSAALAWAVGSALRSRLAGAFTWAALLTTPLWLGMSVIDYKDMPVAAGLTLISAGLILGWTHGRPQGAQHWIAWGAAPLLAAIGGVIALGGRAGAFLLIIAIPAATLAVLALAQLRLRDPRRLLPVVATAAAAVVAALLGVWLTNPIARIDLPAWLLDSYRISKEYIWVGVIRTNGLDVSSTDLPWWYAPAWLLAQLPLLTTAAAAMGAFFCITSLIGSRWGVGRGPILSLTPLLVQGLVLPVLIVGTGSVLYDGIRHLLFMFPGIIAVAAVGVASLERGLQGVPRRAWLAPAVAVLVVGASLFATVRWFPYMYAYVNPVAGWDKSQRNWELDYWGVTAREGVTRLQADGLDPNAVVPASEPSRPYGGLTTDEVAALAPARSGFYAFLRWDSHLAQEWCALTFTIERDGLTLGEGGYCPK